MLTSATTILKEITDDISRIPNPKLQSKADFALRYACLQSWYISCSSLTKITILVDMLHRLENLDALLLILKTLHSCTTKSIVYSECHYKTNFVFDKCVQDDNRTLDPDTLDETKQSELTWFQTLKDSQQILILIGLIRLGGGAVMHKVYYSGLQLYKAKIQQSSDEPLPDATQNIEKIFSARALQETESVVIPPRTVSVVPENMPKINPMDPYMSAVEEARKEWNTMINKYRIEVEGKPPKAPKQKQKSKKGAKGSKSGKSVKSGKSSKSKKSSKKGKKKKGREDSEELDRIQLLPIWIVKRIFSYLDAKTLKRAKQVNSYWAYAISDLQKDMKARKTLNKFIKKMHSSMSSPLQLEKIETTVPHSIYKSRIEKLMDRGCTLRKLRDFTTEESAETQFMVSHAVEQEPCDYILPLTRLEKFPRNINNVAPLYKVPSCVINELGYLKIDGVNNFEDAISIPTDHRLDVVCATDKADKQSQNTKILDIKFSYVDVKKALHAFKMHKTQYNDTDTTENVTINKSSSNAILPASRGENGQKRHEPIVVNSVIPKNREEILKWNGWGYKDSQFVVKDEIIHFTGSRYPIGELALPYFSQWVIDTFNVDLSKFHKPQDLPAENRYPPSRISSEHLHLLTNLGIIYSIKGLDRLVRAHGHTLRDIYILRESFFERIPDIVLWPKCHDDVVRIVEIAKTNNLVVIPFGGGTSVSGAIECPKQEPRTIICLDTSQMNRILWVDHENLVACCESGIIGQDLERELGKLGYTSGHEPDSYEFSSLGGWVATRASGMKKNTYGNIEDLLVHVKMVTTKGVLEKNCQVPRMSCGPDFNHVILGSEGTLGVVTEVVIKIRPLPKCRRYASIVFPNFESGVKCMQEIARQRCQPASVRLMDNEQFKFGQSLRPIPGYFGLLLDGLKKLYITKIKGFNVNSMCVMTLLFEGEARDVELHEKKITEIAARFGGIPAGQTNGERGYMLTFVIAYIRDLGLEYYVLAESFETSVPWDRAVSLCRNVKHCVAKECEVHNITHYMICARVTQTYDAGCVIYFYFAFNYRNIKNPVDVYEDIEEKARDEIVASGGSISHHHGVGKLRKKWYPSTVSEVGVKLYRATKQELDPDNVFACGNFIQSKL